MIKKSKCGRTQNQFVKIIIFYTPKTRYADKEIMDTLPITVTSKKIKYLKLKLIKEVKDSFKENFKTLRKERKTRK